MDKGWTDIGGTFLTMICVCVFSTSKPFFLPVDIKHYNQRADSSILVKGYKRYYYSKYYYNRTDTAVVTKLRYRDILHCYAVSRVDNAMPCHAIVLDIYDRNDIHILCKRETTRQKNRRRENKKKSVEILRRACGRQHRKKRLK